MSIGSALRARMCTLNIGNKELSEKSGVALRTINNILSGVTKNPSINVMDNLSKALACTVDDFLHDAEDEWSEEELAEIIKFKEYLRIKRNM